MSVELRYGSCLLETGAKQPESRCSLQKITAGSQNHDVAYRRSRLAAKRWRVISNSEHRTRHWKVAGLNPCRSGWRIFFSVVSFLCWLLFRYPFLPRVTAVARKRSRLFCPKVQVAGYSQTRMHLTYVALHEMTLWMVVWCTQNAPRLMAAVSCGTSDVSAVSTPLRWIFKKRAIKS